MARCSCRAATTRSRTLGAALLLVVASGCSGPSWSGTIEQWGTMRAVMRDGQKEGRVKVAKVLDSDAMGIGALAGLEGEIVVLHGVAHVTRATPDGAVDSAASATDQAALLVLARVPAWRSTSSAADVELDGLDPRRFGAADAPTIPFVVEGELADLEMHVLRGRCPYAPEDPEGSPPLRTSRASARGTLVGFWTRGPAGVLTHHDSAVHVHVLLAPDATVAHVDRVRVRAGARVLVPD